MTLKGQSLDAQDKRLANLTREGRKKGSKNKASIYKEKILAVIEDELLADIPNYYRNLAELAISPEAPPWAVRLYGELLLKPVMKSAAEDKPTDKVGIRIIVQGSSPVVEEDNLIEAQFEEIEDGD